MKLVASAAVWAWLILQGCAIGFKLNGLIHWSWTEVSMISIIPAICLILAAAFVTLCEEQDDPLDEDRLHENDWP